MTWFALIVTIWVVVASLVGCVLGRFLHHRFRAAELGLE